MKQKSFTPESLPYHINMTDMYLSDRQLDSFLYKEEYCPSSKESFGDDSLCSSTIVLLLINFHKTCMLKVLSVKIFIVENSFSTSEITFTQCMSTPSCEVILTYPCLVKMSEHFLTYSLETFPCSEKC